MSWSFYNNDGQILQGVLAGATLTTPVIAEIDSGADILLDATDDIVLDAGGADILLKDGGTTFGSLNQTGGELRILSGSSPTLAATFAGANVTLAGTVASGAITSTGVITGLTIEATATTASGDNAAIGYTSANGLMLTGQGSTNDITIKNDADELVMSVPTGTQNVTFAGNVTTQDLTVSGTTTTVNTATLSVEDPIIILASGNNAADAVDIGLYGLYDTSGSQDLYSGLFRDASDTKWKLFKDLTVAPTTTVTVGSNGYAVGTLVANIEAATLSVTGVTTFNTVAYTWPNSDGASGASLQTNASGTLAWTVAAAGVGLGLVIALS